MPEEERKRENAPAYELRPRRPAGERVRDRPEPHQSERGRRKGAVRLRREPAGLGVPKKEREDRADAERAERVIAEAGLPTRLEQTTGHPFRVDRLIAHMAQDKKAEGGALVFVLARRIGEALVVKDVDRNRLQSFLLREGAEA